MNWRKIWPTAVTGESRFVITDGDPAIPTPAAWAWHPRPPMIGMDTGLYPLLDAHQYGARYGDLPSGPILGGSDIGYMQPGLLTKVEG